MGQKQVKPSTAIAISAAATFKSATATIPSGKTTIPSATATIPSATATVPSAIATLPSAPTTIPSATTTIQSAATTIPSATATISSAPTTIPPATGTVPSATAIIPSDIATIPSDIAAIPSSTSTIPSATATNLSATSTNPYATVAVPSSTPAIPSTSAAIPSATAAFLSSKAAVRFAAARKHRNPQHIQIVVTCLEQLSRFCGSNKKSSMTGLFRTIVKLMKQQSYEPGDDILKKGEQCSGIYFIIDGTVSVVTEDAKNVIATLTIGQFFGEVSTLYRLPVTARVQADTKCICYVLKEDHVWSLLPNSNKVDIIDWFVARKYVPTSSSLECQRTYRRILLYSFQQLPMFEGWPEQSLKSLILSLSSESVILYPRNCFVCCVNDPGHVSHILLRGRAIITGRSGVKVETTAINYPIIIGEAGLFLETSSCLNLKTVTECQVVSVRKDNIMSCIEEETEDSADCSAAWERRKSQWEIFVQNQAHLSDVPKDLFQYEVIFHHLLKSPLFSNSTLPLLDQLTRDSNIIHVSDGELAYTLSDSKLRTFLLVLGGTLELVEASGPSTVRIEDIRTVTQGQTVAKVPGMPANITYKSVGDSYIVKYPTSILKDALKKFTRFKTK